MALVIERLIIFNYFNAQKICLVFFITLALLLYFGPYKAYAVFLEESDLNNDNIVSIKDFSIFLNDFASGFLRSDINKNGFVDLFDFNILVFNFGKSLAASPSSKPSPTIAPSSNPSPKPIGLLKLGLVGDRNVDEYRTPADDRTNLAGPAYNWVELFSLHRNVDLGIDGNFRQTKKYSINWNDVRDYGFEYNCARSGGAVTKDLYTTQATRQDVCLMNHVRGSKINVAYISFGGNDFRPPSSEPIVYMEKLTRLVNELKAANIKVLVANGWSTSVMIDPEASKLYSPQDIAQIKEMEEYINIEINKLASNNVKVVDLNSLFYKVYNEAFDKANPRYGYVKLGSEYIKVSGPHGKDNYNFWLQGSYSTPGHINTVGMTMYLNEVIKKVNEFGFSIAELTPQEQLCFSNIKPEIYCR